MTESFANQPWLSFITFAPLVGALFIIAARMVARKNDDGSIAAEDLGTVASTDDLGQHHMEGALQRLRTYFVLESLLMIGVVAAAYAGTILGWGG